MSHTMNVPACQQCGMLMKKGTKVIHFKNYLTGWKQFIHRHHRERPED